MQDNCIRNCNTSVVATAPITSPAPIHVALFGPGAVRVVVQRCLLCVQPTVRKPSLEQNIDQEDGKSRVPSVACTLSAAAVAGRGAAGQAARRGWGLFDVHGVTGPPRRRRRGPAGPKRQQGDAGDTRVLAYFAHPAALPPAFLASGGPPCASVPRSRVLGPATVNGAARPGGAPANPRGRREGRRRGGRARVASSVAASPPRRRVAPRSSPWRAGLFCLWITQTQQLQQVTTIAR